MIKLVRLKKGYICVKHIAFGIILLSFFVIPIA